MMVVLLIPIILILLFRFTVSTDVNDIKVAVCAPVRNHAVSEKVDRLRFSPHFVFQGYVDEAGVEWALKTGAAQAVVVFDAEYARNGRFQTVQ